MANGQRLHLKDKATVNALHGHRKQQQQYDDVLGGLGGEGGDEGGEGWGWLEGRWQNKT